MMRLAFLNSHGTEFVAGPTYDTIYPASGVSSDWSYGARGVLGWGFELRDRGQSGFVLPPAQIIPSGEETYAAIMALADAVGHPLRFTFPDGIPTTIEADVEHSLRVVVSPMAATVAAASPVMLTRVGRTGGFVTSPLTHVTGTEYRATLPALGCGAEVSFTFEASTVGGTLVASPAPLAGLSGPHHIPRQHDPLPALHRRLQPRRRPEPR